MSRRLRAISVYLVRLTRPDPLLQTTSVFVDLATVWRSLRERYEMQSYHTFVRNVAAGTPIVAGPWVVTLEKLPVDKLNVQPDEKSE
jgi:hypothetical protein